MYKDAMIAEAEMRDATRQRVTVTADRPIRELRHQRIIREVCAAHGVRQDRLLRKYGPRRYVPARIELARELDAAGYIPAQIGRWLKRDHTTVLWYIGRLPGKRQPRNMP